MLEPAWLTAHAPAYDVVHVHFGFEHLSGVELRALVSTLRELRRPLVLTVHDMENPHLRDQRGHLEALDALVPAAAEVITLTAGAAAEVARRWGRRPVVLPHPHLVDLDRIGRPRPTHDGFVVGLHTKPRAGNAPDEVRAELLRAVADLPGARLLPGPDRRLTDDELWDHLEALDVLVLPYRHGTHSGFVEACHDLGTAVVATTAGHLAEQHPVQLFVLGRPGSLTAALHRAQALGPVGRADAAQRAAEREEVAAAHAALYARVAA